MSDHTLDESGPFDMNIFNIARTLVKTPAQIAEERDRIRRTLQDAHARAIAAQNKVAVAFKAQRRAAKAEAFRKRQPNVETRVSESFDLVSVSIVAKGGIAVQGTIRPDPVLTCPDCDGQRGYYQDVCNGPEADQVWRECRGCNGKGSV